MLSILFYQIFKWDGHIIKSLWKYCISNTCPLSAPLTFFIHLRCFPCSAGGAKEVACDDEVGKTENV